MEYEIVYDAAGSAHIDTTVLGTGLFLICFGGITLLGLLWQRRSQGNYFSPLRTKLALGFVICASIWTIGSSFLSWSGSQELSIASLENSCTMVEGAVENFHPMPEGGGALESFTVNGVLFEYSEFWSTGGYNHAASHGGVIANGLHVRICYVEQPSRGFNVIARLEISK